MATQVRKLAAIMFTDIVGYTALMGSDEKKAFDILKKNRRIHWRLIKKYRGRQLKEMGDGTLASFSSSMDAVLCAISIQLAAEEMEIPLRIGIHQGDVIFEHKDVLGDGVNIASRIQGVAQTQGIAISETIYNEIRNKKGLQVVFLGTKSLKGVSTPLGIYQLSCTDPGILDYSVDTGELVKPIASQRKSVIAGLLIATVLLISVYAVIEYGNYVKNHDNSVLVMPIDDFTGIDIPDYFLEGMLYALTGNIGRIDGLRVLGETTAAAYENTDKSLTEIGRERDVKYIIKTALSCFGEDSICFSAKIFDVYPREKQLEYKEYRVLRSQISNLYNKVTKEFTNAIDLILKPEDEEFLAESRTVNKQAHDLYMKGMIYNDQMSEGALNKANQYFKLAIEIDPNWAAPYQGMASVLERQYQMGFVERSVMMPKLNGYIDKALELDPNSSWVYNLRGSKFGWFEWEWEKAEQDFLKSIELNPNHAGNHAFYAGILSRLRKPDQAIYHVKKAEELEPLDPFILGLCASINIGLGKCQTALEQIKRANAIEQKHYFTSSRLFEASICIGDFQTAFDFMKEENLELWEKYELTEYFEQVFLDKGWPAFLDEFIQFKEEELSDKENTPMLSLHNLPIANLYVMAGNYDKALDYYEKAYEVHSPNLPYISVKSNFDKMRDNPRYLELLKKMNLPVD
jgi:tetratricopeptide (TPR) repeat protein